MAIDRTETLIYCPACDAPLTIPLTIKHTGRGEATVSGDLSTVRAHLDESHPGPSSTPSDGLAAVLAEIAAERARQDAKWGEQNHPDGTGLSGSQDAANYVRSQTDSNATNGRLSWLDVLKEEAFEAFAEHDPASLRAELVQVAAVAVAWIEAIDRRNPAPEQLLGAEADPICGDLNDDVVCALAPHADGDHRDEYATVGWPDDPTV